MKRVIIGGPFGNFLTSIHATSVVGSFYPTSHCKWSPLKTFLQCCMAIRRWPGIGLVSSPQDRVIAFRELGLLPRRQLDEKILSILCISPSRWEEILIGARLLSKTNMLAGVELAIPYQLLLSNKELEHLFGMAMGIKVPVIINPPEHGRKNAIHIALDRGIDLFHISPPIAQPANEMALRINRLHTVGLIRVLKNWRPELELIADGWIRRPEDAEIYARAGASYLNVRWLMTDPRMWIPWRKEAALKELAKLF